MSESQKVLYQVAVVLHDRKNPGNSKVLVDGESVLATSPDAARTRVLRKIGDSVTDEQIDAGDVEVTVRPFR